MQYLILKKYYNNGDWYIHNQKIKSETDAQMLCDTMNKIEDGNTYTIVTIPEEHNLEVVNDEK